MLPLRTPVASRPAPREPSLAQVAYASALVPGLGQWFQRRRGTAGLHFLSTVGYVVGAYRFGGQWWMLGALLINLWSVVDGAWWARASKVDTADPPA